MFSFLAILKNKFQVDIVIEIEDDWIVRETRVFVLVWKRHCLRM